MVIQMREQPSMQEQRSNIYLSENFAPTDEASGCQNPEQPMEVDLPQGLEPEPTIADQDARPPCRPTVEEIDEGGPEDLRPEWVELSTDAGSSHGTSRTLFDTIRDKQIHDKSPTLGPFESDEEWQLAKWLVKNTGHNQVEQFLKLPIVCDQCRWSNDFFETNILCTDTRPCQPVIHDERHAARCD